MAALISQNTNLKSLRYGKDQVGGGNSNQPYIKSPIPENRNQLDRSGGIDFLLRGGTLTPSRAAEDVSRLTKMFGDFKSPNGVLFTAKQNLLSRTGVKTQAGTTDPTMPDLGNDGTGGPLTNTGGDGPVADVAVKASFPGGEGAFRAYIESTFQYPVRCQDEGINGSVILRFIVDKTGKISNIQVVEETKSCPEFTEEAKRVLKNSKRWIPGQNKGQFVVSWREVPIRLSVE